MGEEDGRLHDSIDLIVRRLESEEADPSQTHAGSFPAQKWPPFLTQTGLSPTQIYPYPTQAGPSHSRVGPCLTQIDPSHTPLGPCPTQACPYPTHSDPSHTPVGPCPTQAYPYPTQSDPSHTPVDPCPTQAYPYPTQSDPSHTPVDPCPNQACPYPTQSDPSHTPVGPCPTQACPYPTPSDPSHTPVGPCPTQACSYPTQSDPFHTPVGPCPTQACPYPTQSDHSHTPVGLCPTQTYPYSTQSDPSHTRVDPCSTQVGTFPTQAGLFHTQTGPCSKEGPSYFQEEPPQIQEMMQLQPRSFECKHCHMVFKSQSTLSRHMNVHKDNPTLFVCEHCGKQFTRADRYNLHVKTMHSESKPEYPCFNCDKKYTTSDYRNHHIRYFCPARRKQSLADHTGDESAAVDAPKINLKAGTFQCEQCKRIFRYEKTLKRHMKIHEEDPNIFECEYCGKQFLKTDINQYNLHIKAMHSTKNQINSKAGKFQCEQCKRIFRYEKSLKRHVERKHEKDPNIFECEYCGKQFLKTNINLYDLHIKAMHSTKKPEYSCFYCGKMFTNIHSRKHHSWYNCPERKKRPLLDNTGDESATVDKDVDTHEVGAHDQAAVVEPGPSNVPSGQSSDPDEGGYTCSKCGCRYKAKHKLVQHLKRGCDPPPPISCPDPSCSFKTPFMRYLKRHLFKD